MIKLNGELTILNYYNIEKKELLKEENKISYIEEYNKKAHEVSVVGILLSQVEFNNQPLSLLLDQSNLFNENLKLKSNEFYLSTVSSSNNIIHSTYTINKKLENLKFNIIELNNGVKFLTEIFDLENKVSILKFEDLISAENTTHAFRTFFYTSKFGFELIELLTTLNKESSNLFLLTEDKIVDKELNFKMSLDFTKMGDFLQKEELSENDFKTYLKKIFSDRNKNYFRSIFNDFNLNIINDYGTEFYSLEEYINSEIKILEEEDFEYEKFIINLELKNKEETNWLEIYEFMYFLNCFFSDIFYKSNGKVLYVDFLNLPTFQISEKLKELS